MGLAPGAVTSFYSIDSFNPYSEENENFLAWLYMVCLFSFLGMITLRSATKPPHHWFRACPMVIWKHLSLMLQTLALLNMVTDVIKVC